MEDIELFLRTIEHYDKSSLKTFLILMQTEFEENVGDKEAYMGAKRLFARICCTFNYLSKNHRIDFSNEHENALVANSLMPFLLNKYWDDYLTLQECVENGTITEKQFHYELAFSKTYPRVFVKNLADRLVPFHEYLSKYETSEKEISSGLEELFRFIIKPMGFNRIVSESNVDLKQFLPQKLLYALVNANEKTDSLLSINAFSKEPYFPVCEENGSFYLISPEELLDYCYKSIHRLFMKNSSLDERSALMLEKGANFNRMCANLFKCDFGFESVYENMQYVSGEVDLIVIEKDCLIIIECKSRNYTDKVSGLSESFVKANQSNLDHAFDQINRFIKHLNAAEHATLKDKAGAGVRLNAKDFKYIIPLVINLDNLAEINADYDSRHHNCAYVSYDDLTIIQNTIGKRKWLLVDFLQQLITNANANTMADDIVDMFAFYCQYKNLGILYQDEINICINELGNDYYRDYFSFSHENNPINTFDTDVATFRMHTTESFAQCINRYHESHWQTIESLSMD